MFLKEYSHFTCKSTMEHVYVQTAFFAIVCCGPLLAMDMSESNCYSRFDYDEKMLLRMLKMEDEIGKFRQYIEDLKLKEQSQDDHRKEVCEKCMTEDSLDALQASFNSSMQELYSDVAKLRQKPASATSSAVPSAVVPPIGFTVKGPKTKVNGYLTFKTVITNEGEGYNHSLGTFTSNIAGVYHFSAHICKTKRGSIAYSHCSICKNGNEKVRAFTGPDNTGHNAGYYGASTVANLRLEQNDVVGLCACGHPPYMSVETSFSGHLVGHF